jgi:hypothetical protein
MPEAPEAVEQLKQEEKNTTQIKFSDPYAFLASLGNAPAKEQIIAWKIQTPNGRLRVFTPDGGKRTFIVRAISGMELQKLQNQLPENIAPAKAELEMQYLVGSLCVMWTNATTNLKLSSDDLRNGSAGLPSTLFALISWLSDFVEPDALSVLSAEL